MGSKLNLKEINKKNISNTLTLRYDPSEKPIMKLANLNDFQTTTSDPNGNTTEALLMKSISKFISKGPIAVSLSSGIDSSLCLALLRKNFPNEKIIGICGIFEGGNDESKQAQIIAEKFGADFNILDMESIFSRMPETISITKKPKWNAYQHLIAKNAKKFSDILVTGDGADELFGGYNFRYKKFLQMHSIKNQWKSRAKNYLKCHNRDWVDDQSKLFGNSIKFDWEKIYRYFKPYFMNNLEPLKQIMLADFNGKLVFDFVPTGKVIFKNYHLKGNPIFLNKDLINYALHLPVDQKYDIRTSIGKLILRKIAKRLNVPHIREKKGFSPSLLYDWKKYGKSICENYLLNKQSIIFEKKFINYNWVLKAFEKIKTDKELRYLNRLISILALEIWFRIYLTKELSGSDRL